MSPREVYLYCFARPGVLVDGVTSSGDVIETLAVQDVAAVFRSVSAAAFTAGSAESQDPAWIVEHACGHEKVVECVMRQSPVLPVRFGAVFSSPQALEELLSRHLSEIALFLDDVADKEEWGTKVYVDVERACTVLLASDPNLAERQRCLPASPGTRYFQEKKLRADAEKQLKSWSRTCAGRVLAELSELAVDARTLRLPSCPNRRQEPVLNGAFLLRRGTVSDFRDRFDRITALHAESGIALEISGPWPPYNFCPALGDDTA